MQLSGIDHVGLTLEQAAAACDLEKDEAYLMHLAAIHRLLEEIKSPSTARYPLLAFLQQGLKRKERLTASAAKTRQYLQQTQSVEKIASLRELKQTTIEDHLVEIVLHDSSISIDAFVPFSIQQQIDLVLEEDGTKRLREIKNRLDDKISYFMIRLTLARKERENDS